MAGEWRLSCHFSFNLAKTGNGGYNMHMFAEMPVKEMTNGNLGCI